MTTSNITDAGRENGHEKTPEQIQLEIARTRSAITEDLLALSEKLSPQNLREGAREVIRDARDEAKEVLREAKDAAIDSLIGIKDRAVGSVSDKVGELGTRAREASDLTLRFMSANALAISLVGVGAGVLLAILRGRRGRLQSQGEYVYRYEPYRSEPRGRYLPESTRGVEPYTSEEVSPDTTRSIATRASRAFDAAREEVRHAGHVARERSERTLQRGATRSRELATDHRGAVIALTVAAGLGIGLLLPTGGRSRHALRAAGERLYRDARALGRDVSERTRAGISSLRGRRTGRDDGMTLLSSGDDYDYPYAPELSVRPAREPVTTSTADLPGAPSGVY